MSVRITNNTSLLSRLSELKVERLKRETLIFNELNVYYCNFRDPATYIKKTAKNLAGDQDFKADLLKIIFGAISKFMVRRFSKNSGESSLLRYFKETFGRKSEAAEGSSFFETLSNFFSKTK